jgi:hypothetical protein
VLLDGVVPGVDDYVVLCSIQSLALFMVSFVGVSVKAHPQERVLTEVVNEAPVPMVWGFQHIRCSLFHVCYRSAQLVFSQFKGHVTLLVKGLKMKDAGVEPAGKNTKP